MPFEAFISYAKPDETTAKAACAALEAAGIRCWIAPRDIVPGLEWSAAIVRAIDRRRIMVFIFSSHANQSRQIRREVDVQPTAASRSSAAHRGGPPPTHSPISRIGASADAFTPPLDLAPLVHAAWSLLETQPGADRDASLPGTRHGPAQSKSAAPAGPRPRLRLQSLEGHPRSRWLATALKWSGIVPVLGGSVMTVALLLV